MRAMAVPTMRIAKTHDAPRRPERAFVPSLNWVQRPLSQFRYPSSVCAIICAAIPDFALQSSLQYIQGRSLSRRTAMTIRTLLVLTLAGSLTLGCALGRGTPLGDAAARGDLATMKTLLDAGADPNAGGHFAVSPLA